MAQNLRVLCCCSRESRFDSQHLPLAAVKRSGDLFWSRWALPACRAYTCMQSNTHKIKINECPCKCSFWEYDKILIPETELLARSFTGLCFQPSRLSWADPHCTSCLAWWMVICLTAKTCWLDVSLLCCVTFLVLHVGGFCFWIKIFLLWYHQHSFFPSKSLKLIFT